MNRGQAEGDGAMGPASGISRRRFLGQGAALAAALAPGPGRGAIRSILGTPTQPSNRLALGVIGAGGRGGEHLAAFAKMADVAVVAVADVYERHLALGVSRAGKEARGYRDYRELLARGDLDAVVIATPDHWHARIAVDACEAGRDVYCERPLALTIGEGRAVVRAARRNGTVFQVGCQLRSDAHFRRACELVRSGRIGKIERVRVGAGGGAACSWEPVQAPPAGLDWGFWLGPAPWAEYTPKRCLGTFCWFYDYAGGAMTQRGADYADIAQWGLGLDGGGPIRTEPVSASFPAEGLFEAATAFEVKHTYANGVILHVTTEGEGVRFEGRDGWIKVARDGLTSNRPEIEREPLGAGDVHLYESPDHRRDWLDCIRSRRRPVCDVEIGHRSATFCHLGNMAVRSGKTIQWNPAKELVVNDQSLNRWLNTPYRTPWKSPELV